jgi:hypothetical protein
VTRVGRTVPDGDRTEAADPLLRSKYLDYCSAKVAEVLLALSPDEMFLLAQEAAGDAPFPAADPPGYDEVVRLATEHLRSRLGLPTFEAFVHAYRQDPERFDREMLGLWQTEAEGG